MYLNDDTVCKFEFVVVYLLQKVNVLIRK